MYSQAYNDYSGYNSHSIAKKPNPNPKLTNVRDNPSINRNVFITVLFPLLKMPRYMGTIGKMQGEKNETSPPKNTLPINNCCSNIFLKLLV